MKLTFLGATGTVTGSKYLLDTGLKKILIDCGLFQGAKELRLRNWAPFSVDPSKIDAIVLTHAHIDHSGYIPLLIKNGFHGKIYCSESTRDLCSVLLPDCGHLQEEDARYINKKGVSKHKPALALYTEEDGKKALNYFVTVKMGLPVFLDDNLSFLMHRAGHIIGAAFVTVKVHKTEIVFSGDIGRKYDPLMKPPAIIERADYLVVESTYGNRLHDLEDPLESLATVVSQTAKRGGTIVIPAFAVGRAQILLYYLGKLKKERRIPNIPIFLDSPMAIEATKIFYKNIQAHRLTAFQAEKDVCNVAEFVTTTEDSKKIDTYKMPKIIISASGMATGGRVLHHLKIFLRDHKSTILLAGFQAEQTRGWQLERGEKEVKIFGELVPVKAEVQSMRGISSHADYQEILEWLSHFRTPPQKVYITHGEPDASQALKEKIEERYGWNAIIPHYLMTEDL